MYHAALFSSIRFQDDIKDLVTQGFILLSKQKHTPSKINKKTRPAGLFTYDVMYFHRYTTLYKDLVKSRIFRCRVNKNMHPQKNKKNTSWLIQNLNSNFREN